MLKFKSLKWLFAILCLFGFINGYSQNDKIISGGNTISSYICNGQIYTMGRDFAGGSTPTKINIIDENNNIIPAKQINSGSGDTYIALDINNDVWSWGLNSNGQVGNGTTSNTSVPAPSRVKASDKIPLSNIKKIGGINYLTGATLVNAGGNNCFAILNNGTIASWGRNSTNTIGQLGDGSTTDKYTAVLVIDGNTNLPLDSVSQIAANDNVTYALANGKVYSWGNGLSGTLGRNATGGTWTTDIVSSKAFIIPLPPGVGKIVKIAAGDAFGMILDNFGYIWTWGNGAWDQSTGWGSNIVSGVPQRVVKGTTSTEAGDNDGIYLLAKDIDGGQSFGLAVTVTGAPVAWGGEGCSFGGSTGNGTLNGTPYGGPGYILTSINNWDKDVVRIFRGDLWGFYLKSDNTIKTWGCNSYGQLGLRNTDSKPFAVTWAIEPLPTVNIPFPDSTVCESALSLNPITLNANFVIDPSLVNNYKVTWFKSTEGISPNKGVANIIKGDNITPVTTSNNTYPAIASNLNLSVTSPGKYNVEIIYVGKNGDCSRYPIAKDSVTISTFPQSFTVSNSLTYCGDTATVNVNSTTLTNPVYSWYPATSGNTQIIGTSLASNSTKILVNNIPNSVNGDKIVYVEETSAAKGTILKKSQSCDTTWSTGELNLTSGTINIDQAFATGYTVLKQTTITQLSTMFRIAIDTIGQWGTATVTFAIYGSRPNFELYNIPDRYKIIGTLSTTYTRFRTPTEDKEITVELILKGNVTLNPGVYFIGPYNLTVSGSLSNPKLGKGNCMLSTGIVDDIDGTFIKQNVGVSGYANPNQTSTGYDFNVQFENQQQYCDRVLVTLSNPNLISDTIVGNKIVLSNSNGNKYSVKLVPNTTYSWSYSGQNANITNNGYEIEIAFGDKATSGDLKVVSTNDCETSTRKIHLTINSLTSTDDNSINTTTKQLSNIYNIQGIEVSKNYKGLVIYKYTDGSTEKRIQE